MSTLNSNDQLKTESTTLSSLAIGLVIASSLLGLTLLLFCIYYFKKRNQLVKTTTTATTNEKNINNNVEEEIKKNNLRKGWSLFNFLFIFPFSSLLKKKKNNIKKKNMKPTIVTTILDEIPLPEPTLSRSSIHKPFFYYSFLNHQHHQHGQNHQPPISSSTIYSMNTSTITPSYYEEEGYDPKILYRYNQSILSTKNKNNHHQFLSIDPLSTITTKTSTISDDSTIRDPTILQSLERQRHENDFYYKGTISSNIYRYQHPTISSTSVLSHHHHPNNNNNNNNDSSLNNILLSSFISLPPPSNDHDHQAKSDIYQVSTSSYHVW